MTNAYFSLRMRASRGNKHLSGAERLVSRERIEEVGLQLLQRAMNHSRGQAEQVRLSLDLVPAENILYLQLPDLSTISVQNYKQGRCAAMNALLESGVSEEVARQAFAKLENGAAPDGHSLRGAMLVDVTTGRRLDADPARGVRASRLDIIPEAMEVLRRKLQPLGLDNLHVREALVLAAKVLAMPGMVAELCWSDDPDYTAGYVASAQVGYRRFPQMKPPGDERGGRVFFVRSDGATVEQMVEFLETVPVLVTAVGRCCAPETWSEDA